MKQGTDFVFVKFSMELFEMLRDEGWSRPVQLKLDESYNGDIALITRDVSGVSLRELAKSL